MRPVPDASIFPEPWSQDPDGEILLAAGGNATLRLPRSERARGRARCGLEQPKFGYVLLRGQENQRGPPEPQLQLCQAAPAAAQGPRRGLVSAQLPPSGGPVLPLPRRCSVLGSERRRSGAGRPLERSRWVFWGLEGLVGSFWEGFFGVRKVLLGGFGVQSLWQGHVHHRGSSTSTITRCGYLPVSHPLGAQN